MRRSRRCFECCFARRVSHKPPNGPLKRASSGAEPAYRCCAAALVESSSPPVDLPRFGRHGLLGRWLFDFAGCGCCLGLLVLSRGDHAERGVAAVAVVERLDVLEHGGPELEPRWPAAAVDELLLERREETSRRPRCRRRPRGTPSRPRSRPASRRGRRRDSRTARTQPVVATVCWCGQGIGDRGRLPARGGLADRGVAAVVAEARP